MNNKEFSKYFKPKNNVPLYIGVGIVVFAVLVAALYWLPLGVCFGFIGVAVIGFGRDSRPSDAEIDNAVAGRVADIDEQLRMRLGKREKFIGGRMPDGIQIVRL